MNWLARILAQIMANVIMDALVLRGRWSRGNLPTLKGQYEEVAFRSRGSRIRLWGCFFPAERSRRCIILVPGGTRDCLDPNIGMPELAQQLVKAGYNVLFFDLRGHGRSGGAWRMQTLGKECEDVLGALDYLIKNRGFAPERIGIVGFSLGAVAALVAAVQEERVPAVVAESSWARFWTVFEEIPGQQPDWVKRYAPALIWMVRTLGVKPPDLFRLVPKIRAKLFFIHGELDEALPTEGSRRLAEASPGSQLWIVPEASHCRAFQTHPEEYIQRLTTFFGNTL